MRSSAVRRERVPKALPMPYWHSHKALPTLGELQIIKVRLEKGVNLAEADRQMLVDLIEAIADGRDVLEQYWLKRAKKLPNMRKMHALWDIAVLTTPQMPAKEIDERVRRIAPRHKMGFEALKHVYREYLLPARLAIIRKQKKDQSEN